MRRAQLFGYSLRLAYSGWPAGFIFSCFYLSKIQSGKVVGLSSLWKSQSLQINMHLEYLIEQLQPENKIFLFLSLSINIWAALTAH